jgi:UDP-GlcNAc:undecaprenyl-phosphate/decaprenyl-phosphate GlcNAc-1-phosphate transferase
MFSILDPIPYIHWLWPLGATAVFIPLWAKWVAHRRVTAVQDFRRQNGSGIPLMGGVPIALTFFAGAFTVAGDLARVIALSSIPLLVVSALDDVHQVSARGKFLGQLLTVGIFLSLAPSESLLLQRIGVPAPIAQFMTGFWILGMINAVNMIDGMDGEAGGFAAFTGLALYLMFRANPHAPALAILASATIGFLIYNFQPAQIYLGDIGSAFLGFALAASASCLPVENPGWIHAFVPLMLFSFAEVDAIRSMFRRWRSNSPLTMGDHQHLHHKLLKVDLSVRVAWTVIMAVIGIGALAALGIFFSEQRVAQLLLLALATAGLVGQLLWLDYAHDLVTKRVSSISSNLLTRFLHLKPDAGFVNHAHHLTIYDLMPYYKELQQRGIMGVTQFLEDFAKYVAAQHPEALHISMIGHASIVVADPGVATVAAHNDVIRQFYALIDRHKVRVNDSKRPWGVNFPRHDSRTAKDVYNFVLTKPQADELNSSIRKAS